MSAQPICPDCQRPLPDHAPLGICPECLLKRGLGSEVEIGTSTESPARKSPDAGDRPPPTVEELTRFFPQLEVLSFIGRGGMGAVYQARQKQLGRVVALKILPPEVSADPAFAERFAREARALARLNHPNIVTIHDFGQTDGLFFLVMEYVDGVNLRQLLQAGRLSPREALAIVPQICDALQYAHDKGIVHRDIKPENILLDRLGRVKVADFGLAKLMGSVTEPPPGDSQIARDVSLTDAGHVLGTPQYMAPEQRERPTEVDHRADIYSLGVVFYQMLTGELPGERIEPPSKKVVIDVRLDQVVLRALERTPALRYQQVSDVKTMVEAISRTPPVPDPGAHVASRSIWSRTPWQIWIVIAMLALEGIGNLLAIPHQPQALFWLLAKGLFIMGLLLRWRPVFVMFQLVTAVHVSYFLPVAPGVAALNVVLLVLVGSAFRHYFGGGRAPRVTSDASRRRWLKAAAWATWGLSAVAIGLGVFFVHAWLTEQGGWHPRPAEAVSVLLVWLMAFLLPVGGWRLWRAAMPHVSGLRRGWFWLGGTAVAVTIVMAVSLVLRLHDLTAWRAMEDARRTLEAAEVLDQWRPKLRSTDVEERRNAASRIMSEGRWAKPAVPDLIRALGDEDYLVRTLAAQALGYVGEPAGPTASEALQRALGDTHQQVRHQAAVALASVDRETTANLAVLMDRLTNRPPDDPHGIWPIQRREAAEALGVMATRARTALPLLRTLTGEREGLGEAAQKAIDRIEKSKPLAPTRGTDPAAVVRTEEILSREINRRLMEAGWKVEGLFVSVSPDRKRAECRFGRVTRDGFSTVPFHAAIRLKPQGGALWLVEGDGEFRDVRFSVDASAGKTESPARQRQLSGRAGTIRRVVVTGDKAVVEGHTSIGTVVACGLQGVGLTLVNELAADGDFTAEVGFTEKGGLSLGTRRTGTGVSLSATISGRQLDPAHPFAEGRLVFRQGSRLPEPDGSFLIADFHSQDNSTVPIFVRLQATAGSPRTVVAAWLRQAKAGHREAALALTNGDAGWSSSVTDSPDFDSIRPARQLGNQDQAMVVTTPFRDKGGDGFMFHAMLVRRNGRWLIDRYDVATRDETTQLMKGFLLNQGVKFDVPVADLVGGWDGPCMEFRLEAHGTGQWLVTGPEGPLPKPIPFRWEVKASSLTLRIAEAEQKLEITWVEDDALHLRDSAGQGRVVFRNRPHRPAQAPAAANESLRDSSQEADKPEPNSKPASTAPPAAAAKGSGATSDDEGPWGPAVEGVSIRLRAVEPDAAGGEIPVLAVDLQNRGLRDLLRSVAGQRDWQLAVDGKWYVWPPFFWGAGRMPLGPNAEVRGTRLTVSPIWQEARPEDLDFSVVSYESSSDAADAERPLIRLTPGKHTIRVACVLLPRQENSGDTVRVVSNALEVDLRERRFASWPASPDVAQAVIELYEQCHVFIQPTAPRKADEGLATVGELQATVRRLIKLAAGTPLEIVAESLLGGPLTYLKMSLKNGGKPSPEAVTGVMQRARDLVALLGAERGPQPADFGIEAADPDLALAKMYDGECNRCNDVVADQRLAEKHYLAYIARTADSAAKARAWAQIGNLYSTSYHREKGEQPDYEKARRAFAEVLKLEPRRIGRATLLARTKEVVPGLAADERLRIRVKTVKWLQGIDEPTLRRDWLPDERRDQPTDQDIRAFLKLVANVQSGEENNLVGNAASAPDPAASLKWVISELPGSAAAAAAQRHLDELAK